MLALYGLRPENDTDTKQGMNLGGQIIGAFTLLMFGMTIN